MIKISIFWLYHQSLIYAIYHFCVDKVVVFDGYSDNSKTMKVMEQLYWTKTVLKESTAIIDNEEKFLCIKINKN